MPITVKDLIEKVGLDSSMLKKVKWGTLIDTRKEGVYIISLSDEYDRNKPLSVFPISMTILKLWIEKVGGFKLDKKLTYNRVDIANRLSKFWIEDESILYIGKAPIRKNGKGLGNRLKEYYKTSFGERGGHSGGHWIKSLENLDDCYVYYIECSDCSKYESLMLKEFGDNISNISKLRLFGTGVILPFANLEDGRKKRKKHGLGHMKVK